MRLSIFTVLLGCSCAYAIHLRRQPSSQHPLPPSNTYALPGYIPLEPPRPVYRPSQPAFAPLLSPVYKPPPPPVYAPPPPSTYTPPHPAYGLPPVQKEIIYHFPVEAAPPPTPFPASDYSPSTPGPSPPAPVYQTPEIPTPPPPLPPPVITYVPPAPVYTVPDTGSSVPDTEYAAPDTSYYVPDTVYTVPDVEYGAPFNAETDQGHVDISLVDVLPGAAFNQFVGSTEGAADYAPPSNAYGL